jgi:sugar (pentulose or hexulose) kinase
MKKVLAIDMGATSIRGVIGYIEAGFLITEEVMRMPHKLVKTGGRLRWQWKELLSKVERTIQDYASDIVSVGIDTWGVDMGLLDEKGELVSQPVSYRDPEHERGYRLALKRMGEKDIFLKTGTQVMPINTLFQLITMKEYYGDEWKKAKKILMLPDLFHYELTGVMACEETILSTSQLMDLVRKQLNESMMEAFGIKPEMFPPVIQAGKKLGNTRTSRLEGLRDLDVDVISVCGHDTASAVLLTESFKNPDCLFLSCGTWSLFGGLTGQAVLTPEAYDQSLTNELGFDSSHLFFKNITGLYLVEKLKGQMEEEQGRKIDYNEITEAVRHSRYTGLIDVSAQEFSAEDLLAKEAIGNYLMQTGQLLPDTDMDYFKVIYESLADKYLEVRKAIEGINGKKYQSIHMIGGGANSPLLCQMIADRLDLPVTAGPVESAALGNLLIQLKAAGELESMEEGVRMAERSVRNNHYNPS